MTRLRAWLKSGPVMTRRDIWAIVITFAIYFIFSYMVNNVPKWPGEK